MNETPRAFARQPSEQPIVNEFLVSSDEDELREAERPAVVEQRISEPPDDPKASSPPERVLQPTALVTDALEGAPGVPSPGKKSTTPEDPDLGEAEESAEPVQEEPESGELTGEEANLQESVELGQRGSSSTLEEDNAPGSAEPAEQGNGYSNPDPEDVQVQEQMDTVSESAFNEPTPDKDSHQATLSDEPQVAISNGSATDGAIGLEIVEAVLPKATSTETDGPEPSDMVPLGSGSRSGSPEEASAPGSSATVRFESVANGEPLEEDRAPELDQLALEGPESRTPSPEEEIAPASPDIAQFESVANEQSLDEARAPGSVELGPEGSDSSRSEESGSRSPSPEDEIAPEPAELVSQELGSRNASPDQSESPGSSTTAQIEPVANRQTVEEVTASGSVQLAPPGSGSRSASPDAAKSPKYVQIAPEGSDSSGSKSPTAPKPSKPVQHVEPEASDLEPSPQGSEPMDTSEPLSTTNTIPMDTSETPTVADTVATPPEKISINAPLLRTRASKRKAQEAISSAKPDQTPLVQGSSSPTPPKKPRTRKAPELVPTAPTRKSLRIQEEKAAKEAAEKEEEEKEEDDVFPTDLKPSIPRGVVPPLGLIRIPFPIHLIPKPDTTKDRVQSQLECTMIDDPKVNRRRTQVPIGQGKKKSEDAEEAKKVKIEIPIGKEHQAVLPCFSEDKDYTEREMVEDKEELFWKSPTSEKMRKVIKGSEHLTDDQLDFYYYGQVYLITWRTTWRQFKSHIPFEYVLRTIMECDYDPIEALKHVEKCLLELPQIMSPISSAQAGMIRVVLTSKKSDSRRILQETAMRTYHIGEVQNFLIKFRMSYKKQERYGVACTCNFALCDPVQFEPQFACKNCSKEERDTSNYAPEQLCLLCDVYKRATGMDRPSKTTFNDEEVRLMVKWTELEKELDEPINRKELLELDQEEKDERYRKNDLTPEEREKLDYKNLTVPNRISTRSLTPSEQKFKNEKICMQLQPFVLPHFTECRCKISGEISKMSKRYEKGPFSEEEKRIFSKMIGETNGDVEMAAKNLGVEEQLVERFIDDHREGHPVWKDYPGHNFHNYPLRKKLDPEGLPPELPGRSREDSPYLSSDDKPQRKPKRRVRTNWSNRRGIAKKAGVAKK